MNIIQLFSLPDLNTDQILEFGAADYIRIEKRINLEKKINPEIDSKTSENLILALKEYKEELLFVMSHRIFFNLFTHNDFDKDYFTNYNLTVSDEKIKDFIGLFLADDLISYFSIKLAKSTSKSLKKLDTLLKLKRYFSEDIIHKMTLLVYSKLDFAISQLAVLKTSDHSAVSYIEFKSFYDFLSHFASIELDRKIDKLLLLVVRAYKENPSDVFFISVIKSMPFYTAFNENMTRTLAKNRDLLLEKEEENDNDKIHFAIKIILAIAFLLFAFSKIGLF